MTGSRPRGSDRRPAALESAVAWELRAAWALGREVVLSLRAAGRVQGVVRRVAPTDAFAVVWDGAQEVHVPLALVRAVRASHWTDGGGAVAPEGPRPRDVELPGQLTLFSASVDRPDGWVDPRDALEDAAGAAALARAENRERHAKARAARRARRRTARDPHEG